MSLWAPIQLVGLVFHQNTEGTSRITGRCPRTTLALPGVLEKTLKAGAPGCHQEGLTHCLCGSHVAFCCAVGRHEQEVSPAEVADDSSSFFWSNRMCRLPVSFQLFCRPVYGVDGGRACLGMPLCGLPLVCWARLQLSSKLFFWCVWGAARFSWSCSPSPLAVLWK